MDLEAAHRMWELGVKPAEIARRLGVSRERVRQVSISEGWAAKLPARAPCWGQGPHTKSGLARRGNGGLCCLCKKRYERTGTTAKPAKRPAVRTCEGCGELRKISARERCRPCYQNWIYHNLPGRKARACAAVRRWQKKIRAEGGERAERFRSLQRPAVERYRARRAEAEATTPPPRPR